LAETESIVFETRNESDSELTSMEEFRLSEAYDPLIAQYFANQITGKTAVDIFTQLQPVIYFGYSLGIRDANQAGTRE
jgi:hypothetical protein